MQYIRTGYYKDESIINWNNAFPVLFYLNYNFEQIH